MELTSVQNDTIKYITKLQNPQFRKQEKLILIDGIKSIFSILDYKMNFEYLFLKKDCDIENIDKIVKISKKVFYVNSAILKKISTTKTPTDIIGVIKEPEIDINIFKKIKKIALIESIKDTGNLGTIIRSACAFNIEGIILFGDCVDLYNTKTIRAAAQNIFKIPIIKTKDLNFIKSLLANHEMISFVVNSKNNYLKSLPLDDFILAFGSEASGLTDELIKISNKTLTFPMENDVESLNLAICASITFSMIYFLNKK